MATDEAPLTGAQTYKTPDWNTVGKPAYLYEKARLVGILGSGYEASTLTDLRQMATDTNAVDASAGNAPLSTAALTASA
jgi:hypothetical protein